MPYRLLLATHHITSRAKIQRLTRAAEHYNVSVLIKMTIKPTGYMICESDRESSAREWLAVVKSLRYKGYRFVHGEQLPGPRIVNSGRNGAKIVHGSEEFSMELSDLSKDNVPAGINSWWKAAMKFSLS